MARETKLTIARASSAALIMLALLGIVIWTNVRFNHQRAESRQRGKDIAAQQVLIDDLTKGLAAAKIAAADVRAAVVEICSDGSCVGPQGAQGPAPTADDVLAAVTVALNANPSMVLDALNAYCDAHNGCVGPQGVMGPPGKDGARGADGKDGAPGAPGRTPVRLTCNKIDGQTSTCTVASYAP